jgi:type II secretory pathway pseudopilin PulG
MMFGLRRVHAFSLVELTVAIGIAAFCLIAVFGLLPVGVQTNRNATSQTAATNILADVIADIRATARATVSATPSQLYVIAIPVSGGSNGVTQTRYFDGDGRCACDSVGTKKPNPLTGSCSDIWSPPLQLRYRLSMTFPSPPTGLSYGSYADAKVTWPAVTDPATTMPSGAVEMFAAFQRN